MMVMMVSTQKYMMILPVVSWRRLWIPLLVAVVFIAAVQGSSSGSGGRRCSSTTHLAAYDESCLTKDYAPWSMSWSEIQAMQQCCVQFWCSRLWQPHSTATSTGSSGFYATDHVFYTSQLWQRLANDSTHSSSHAHHHHSLSSTSTAAAGSPPLTAFQQRYEHLPEPSIRVVDSKTQILQTITSTPRSHVFISQQAVRLSVDDEELVRSPAFLKLFLTIGQLHQSRDAYQVFAHKRTKPQLSQLLKSPLKDKAGIKSNLAEEEMNLVEILPKGLHPSVVKVTQSSKSTDTSDQSRSTLISCFYSSQLEKKRGNQSPEVAIADRCVEANIPKGLCSLCQWNDIDIFLPSETSISSTTTIVKKNEIGEKKMEDLLDIFLRSRFVHMVKGVGGVMDDDFTFEIIACGAVPIVSSKEGFLQEVMDSIDSKKRLPVEYLAHFDNYPSQQAEDKLRQVFQDMVSKKDQYTLSPLLSSYWLAKVIPMKEIKEHISRQRSRHFAFLHQHLPFLQHILELSSTKTDSYYLQHQIKSKEFCHIPSAEKVHKSSIKLTSHSSKKQSHSMKSLNATEAVIVDIVIPRCCESKEGDLAWLQNMISSISPNIQQGNKPWIRVHIYYKCPWCVPKSKYDSWKDLILQDSSKHDSTAWKILQGKAGIYLLDDFSTTAKSQSHDWILHHPAFDWYANGKEATAYLQHIVQHYPQKNFAKFTLFLHTQPAHHLDLTRIIRFLAYIKVCHVEGAYSMKQHNRFAYEAMDFLPLNYRHMSDLWAHQPEQCLMSLLHHVFHNTQQDGDDRRLPPSSRSIQDFYQMKIASNVAAQFVATDHSIYHRPFTFWNQLLLINNHSLTVGNCSQQRSYKEGTEVACAMERIWHNFFRTPSSSHKEPLFMEDYPKCCEHFLPQLLSNIPNPSSSNPHANVLSSPFSSPTSSTSFTGSVTASSSSSTNNHNNKKRSQTKLSTQTNRQFNNY